MFENLNTPFTRYGKLGKTARTLIWLDDNNYLNIFCKNNNLDYKEVSNFLKFARVIIEKGDFNILESALKEKKELQSAFSILNPDLL